MQIHAFRTGTISVKTSYHTGRGESRIQRLTSVMLDPTWRDIPVYCWAIEHPEGVIVIDAGESAKVNRPDFFPLVQRPFWRTQYRFHVAEVDEIGSQLKRVGIAPGDVRWLVLTHTHFDHTDGLYHFPNAVIYLSRKEHEDTIKYRSAHFAFPSKWPETLRRRLVDYVPEPVGPFDQSYALTREGDVRLVPTPGHTSGHQSLILHEGNRSIFFGGDTSFDLASLLNGTLDAPAVNAEQTYATRRRILQYAEQTELVYLTTHDFATEQRLTERTPIATQAIRQTHSSGVYA